MTYQLATPIQIQQEDFPSYGIELTGSLKTGDGTLETTAYDFDILTDINILYPRNISQAVAYNSDSISNLNSGQTASSILTKLRTVDGEGSGLDADTVRGYVPVNKAGDAMTGLLDLNYLRVWDKNVIELQTQNLYLDEVNGDDSNDGKTAQTALKTATELSKRIPMYINSDLTISVIGDYSGTIFINSVQTAYHSSRGTVTLKGITNHKTNHNVFGVRVTGVTRFAMQYLSVGINAVNFTASNFTVSDCSLTCAGVSGTSAVGTDHSFGSIVNSDISTPNGQGVLATAGSIVSIYNCTGDNARSLVTNGGIIIKSGTVPNGTELLSTQGGSIFERNIGGIREVGSNANGEWIRFEDGTQICYTHKNVSIGTMVNAPSPFWNAILDNIPYPADFLYSPSVQVKMLLGEEINCAIRSVATGYVNVRFITYTDLSNTLRPALVIAIGRWK